MKSQKKSGALLSYLNMALSMVVNIFLTPMLIDALTDEVYSIYKIMQSFTGPLVLFNLGLSTIVARSIAKFRSADDGNRIEKENTLAMAIIVAMAVVGLIIALGLVMRSMVPVVYDNMTPDEVLLGQQLFLIFVISTGIHVLSDVFKGCLIGNERFTFLHGLQTVQYVVKFGGIILLLKLGAHVTWVAFVELLNSVLFLVGSMVFSIGRLKERPKLHYFDKKQLMLIASFAAAIILQALVNQINNHVDIMILGAVVSDARIITMYSSALSIYSIYNSLMSVFTGMYFPQATRLVESGCTSTRLTDFLIQPGRYQMIVAIGVLGAFALFGKDFIEVWIGAQYHEAYYVALMLMVPVTVPLVENVCISVLDAKLKRMFRSAVLAGMAIFNVIATILLVRVMDFWGAAVATMLSLIIGHGILMNVYYQKVLGIQVVRMFREMCRGILPVGILTSLICLPLTTWEENTFICFLLKCGAFAVVYGLLLLKCGMNQTEKNLVKSLIKR